ncbi:MAG: bifunctional phosphoglucose/phosphomannose isomerase [Candidatus Bathyarchaeia archaeon]
MYDEKRISDRFNVGGLAESFPEQFEEAYRIGLESTQLIEFEKLNPNMILFAGVGGSAVGGDLIRDWLRFKVRIPIDVYRGYDPPVYISDRTVVFAISYSGNTEETLNFMIKAHKLGCRVISLSSGGLMEKLSERLKIPHVKVPPGLLPRAAIAYLSTPLIPIIEKLAEVDLKWEVDETLENLKKLKIKLARAAPTEENPAKRLAGMIYGKMPVIFGYGYLSSVARRFKNQLNENSKVAARWDEFPELNHNEVMVYQKPEYYVKNQFIIFLRGKIEPPEITARIEITKEIIRESVSGIYDLHGFGSSILSNMYTVLYMADFTSIYLAYLRSVDPGDTSLIEDLKKKLDSSIGMLSKIRNEYEL